MKKLRLVALVGVLAFAATTLTGCGLFASWVDKGVEVVSPDNVEEQFADVIRNWNALTVTANNACLASVETERDSDSPVLVESPAFAYVATYRNVWLTYNSIQADIFKAGLVGPPGYPKEIPDYPETQGKTPDFCQVGTNLANLKAAS